MSEVKVWDVFVRVFHWSLVICFSLNALLLDDESKWHQWVGYMVAGLVALRILWGFSARNMPVFPILRPV